MIEISIQITGTDKAFALGDCDHVPALHDMIEHPGGTLFVGGRRWRSDMCSVELICDLRVRQFPEAR